MKDTTYTTEDGRFTATVSFNASETTWGYHVHFAVDDVITDTARFHTKEEAQHTARFWVELMAKAQQV